MANLATLLNSVNPAGLVVQNSSMMMSMVSIGTVSVLGEKLFEVLQRPNLANYMSIMGYTALGGSAVAGIIEFIRLIGTI